jgi:hypothetical protein
MPDYRLKNGKIVTVKEEDIQSFMSSKLGNGAVLIEEEVKPVKTEGSATGVDALPRKKTTPVGTVLDGVNGSSELENTDPDEPISASKIRSFIRC